MLNRHLLSILLVLPAGAAALDAGSNPDYLTTKFRAEWRLKPLGEVLSEIEKATGKPVVATAAVQALGGSRQVILLDDRKSPLRETLERLESVQDLRFTAEPLRLLVESAADAQARRRRPVDLNLSEYMLFSPVRDFPGPELGLGMRQSDVGANALHEAGSSLDAPADVSEVIGWLRGLGESGEMKELGRTAVQVLATPEEEAVLRKALDEHLAASTRQTTWRITWGLAPAGGSLPTGVIPAAEAARTAAALEPRIVEQLHALPGQRVHGGRLREQSYVGDAEIVASRLDPVSDVLTTGRHADLRPLPGGRQTIVAYRLSWVDLTAMGTAAIGEGAGPAPPPAKEGETAMPAPPGEQLTLQLPALWTWQPVGDVVLPHGQGLVLCAEHPQGRAVVVLEEVR